MFRFLDENHALNEQGFSVIFQFFAVLRSCNPLLSPSQASNIFLARHLVTVPKSNEFENPRIIHRFVLNPYNLSEYRTFNTILFNSVLNLRLLGICIYSKGVGSPVPTRATTGVSSVKSITVVGFCPI